MTPVFYIDGEARLWRWQRRCVNVVYWAFGFAFEAVTVEAKRRGEWPRPFLRQQWNGQPSNRPPLRIVRLLGRVMGWLWA